tara:strand:- start:8 stop:310 length:303 start_codon:yes stop_codon:yes gene_type:complete
MIIGPSSLNSDNLAYFPLSIFIRELGILLPTNDSDKANWKINRKRIRLVLFIENYLLILSLVTKFMRRNAYRTTANFPINGSLLFPAVWMWYIYKPGPAS